MSVHRSKLIQGLCLGGAFVACSAAAQGESTTRGAPAQSLTSMTPFVETGPGGCSRDVGLLGSYFEADLTAFLTGAGHTVSLQTAASISGGSLATIDVLYITRAGVGDAAAVAATIEAWVRGGGVLITEFDATVQLLDGVTYGMFAAATLDNGFAVPSGNVCGENAVNIVNPANPLSTGLGAGWACSGDPIGVLKVFNEATLDAAIDIAARIKLDTNGDGINDAVAGHACVDNGAVSMFFTDFADWSALDNPHICPNPNCLRTIQDETLLNNAVCMSIAGCGQEHPCPWDCGIPHNKSVDIIDFLALLGQWGIIGAPCDFGLGDPGVSVNDFLKLLSAWGPCPTPSNDECPGITITRSDPEGTIEVHFDMYGATPSPFPYQCFPVPPIVKDTWYCLLYQPISDIKKNVTISTTVPLGIEVYAGCQCPPGPVIACGFGVDGTPQISMQPGDSILIRLANVQQLPNDFLKGLLIIENKIPPQPVCTVPARIDFGVTVDDFGNNHACPGPNVIGAEYVLTQGIVFGTAVDNFSPPPVAVQDDGACFPSCRSSGQPAFAADWWCQFRIALGPGIPGPKAGVPVFSAQVCFIDAPPGTVLMEGYNNDRALIATAANSVNNTEVLTVFAPPGDLIAYVRVVSSNPARPAGLSIDCLDYPNPTERVDTNFFEDPGQFFQALSQTEKLQKFFWDFKPHDQAPIAVPLNGPLDINTHGLDPDDPWTDPAGGNLWPPFVDNVQFNTNLQPQGPFAPRNLDAIAFFPAGTFPGFDNNLMLANFFVDSFEIISGPPAGDNHTAFALEVVSIIGPLPTLIHVTVYDKQDQELGKYVLKYDGGKRFLGILTKDQVTIGRIDIWDVGGGAEGVSSIAAFAKNPSGCPGPESCCVPHGTPACDNVDCCRRVCAIDPFCCDIQWDQICVNEAATFPQCGCGNPFGCPGQGDCCQPTGLPGCNNVDCCRRVCTIDPFCCNVAWDQLCVDQAATFPQCGCGGGQNACEPPGVCGTFQVCGIGTPFDCLCWEIDFNPAGPGMCLQDFFCTSVVPCPPGGCPPGFVCVTNSCCGPAFCVPIIKCDPVPSDAGRMAVPEGSGLTGSGAFIEAGKK